MFTSDFNIEGPRKKAATYDDIINAPEHLVAEILNGELFLSRRGAPLPAYTTTALRSIIHPPFSEALAAQEDG